jgi:hypothetical protein
MWLGSCASLGRLERNEYSKSSHVKVLGYLNEMNTQSRHISQNNTFKLRYVAYSYGNPTTINCNSFVMNKGMPITTIMINWTSFNLNDKF